MNCRLIILDCNRESHPAICFNLEIARCETRVVFNENEALNLIEIAQQTGELFDCLLVNNPVSIKDLYGLLEQIKQLGSEIPIVFVKKSRSMQEAIPLMTEQYPNLNIGCCEPTNITTVVMTLIAENKMKIAE